MNNLSDGKLIARAREGDEESLTIFLDRHRNALRKYLAAEAGNWDVARDLVQDAEIKFWQHYRDIKNDESARTYLFRIGYRNFLDWQRRESRRRELAQMVPILNEDERENYIGVDEPSDDGEFIERLDRQMDAEKRLEEILPPGTATAFRSGGALKRKQARGRLAEII